MLFAETGNIGDNNLVGNGSIRLEAGAYSFLNTATKVLQADVRRQRLTAAGQEITGAYYLDMLYAGQLPSALPTGMLDANLKMFLDATYASGTSIFTVQRESIRPLKVA
jgi:hypothetical protein